MTANKSSRATKALEKALATRPAGKHILRLYVAGATERSRQAVLRARKVREAEFKTNFELQVIDVYQQPLLARAAQIVATPTLVKEFPPPVRRLIGNLSNTASLFVGSDLDARGTTGFREPPGVLPPERGAAGRRSSR